VAQRALRAQVCVKSTVQRAAGTHNKLLWLSCGQTLHNIWCTMSFQTRRLESMPHLNRAEPPADSCCRAQTATSASAQQASRSSAASAPTTHRTCLAWWQPCVRARCSQTT
jgi:hypothetical protein